MSISEQEILKLANEYSAHSGLKLSTISTYAANDGKFLDRLQSRGSCTVRTARIVWNWFSDNWPDKDLDWPKDISRPVRPKAITSKEDAA
ncbi:hypothetical protein ABEB22_18475 (plasmid) [Thioclava sp. 'Guangxiensis']|uniref:hypothetical protein n=1 Tax=Thioclava sp. 'Guangxiensis' TaxID=3149044 RepID=UPI0032C4A46E